MNRLSDDLARLTFEEKVELLFEMQKIALEMAQSAQDSQTQAIPKLASEAAPLRRKA
jgi:hypothetical protein